MSIKPEQVSILVEDAEGYRQLAVCIEEMEITDPFKSSCGRFEVEPETEHGIPDDFARAMGIINMWLRKCQDEELAEFKDRRYVAAWTTDFVNQGPEDHDISFFCDGNCYEPDEIAQIKALEVGDIFTSKHYGNSHIVYRRK
jgi:hypothetical protein